MPHPLSAPEPVVPSMTRPGREAVESAGLYLVRTLVVDGDVATRDLLVEAAGNRGHQVMAARTLDEAVAHLSQQSIDCLVVKLRLAWTGNLSPWAGHGHCLTTPAGGGGSFGRSAAPAGGVVDARGR